MASTPAPPRAELARSHTPLLAGGSTRRGAAPESSAPQQKGGWRTLLAGGGAGAIDCFVTMPMDTLSTQMQLIGCPDWIKVVVVRDPLERLLSGYLDKCGR